MARRTSVIQVMITGDASDLNKATQSGSQGMSLLGASAITAAKLVASSASAIAAFSIREFTKFDSKLVQSQAIMGDLSETMQRDMSNAAREVAKTTTFSASEAAEAFYFLASAGMTAEQSIAALPAMASFAQAGMFNLARATDILTDAVTALGLGSDDATENLASLTRISDVLVKQAQISNASVEQFGDAVLRAAPLARDTGVEIEELAAALGVLADRNVKGATAGEQFAILLRDLPRAVANNRDEFKAFGIAVENAEGGLRPLADIVEDFDRALDGLSVTQRAAAFDTLGLTRSSAVVMRQFLGTADALREYQAAGEDAFGATIEVQEKQLASFANQIALTRSMFADIGITIGEALAGPLLLFNDWLREQGPNIEAFVERAIPKIEDFVERSIIKFNEFRDYFNENLRQPLEDFKETLKGFGETGRQEFDVFFERIRNFAKDFKAALEENETEEAGRLLGEFIAETFRQAFARAEVIGEAIRNWAQAEDWGELGRFAGSVAVDFFKGFAIGLFSRPEVADGEIEEGAKGFATRLVDGIIGALILSRVPLVGGIFRVMLAPLTGGFRLLWSSLAARVTPVFGSTLLGIITGGFRLLGTLLANIGILIGRFVLLPLADGLRAAITAIGPKLASAWQLLQITVRSQFRNWAFRFTGVAGATIGQAFRLLLGAGLRWLATAVAGFVAAIFGWPAVLIAAIVAAITIFIVRFRNWFKNQDREFENIGSAMVEFIQQGISKLAAWFDKQFGDWFRARIASFKTALANAKAEFTGMGEGMISNIIAGIRSKASELRDSLVNAAKSAWEATKKFLGISSPSRLFEGIGENMMEGLARGVAESTALIQSAVGAQSAMAANEARRFAEMAAAQRVATAPAAPAQSITVNVSGGMMDPEGVAREVVRVLNDSNRRAGGGGGLLLL